MAFTPVVSTTVTDEVISYGTQTIVMNGTATNTTVNFSGRLYVSSGGTTNNAVINSTGQNRISAGGTANSTVINYFGFQYVMGYAENTTINSGGTQGIYGKFSNYPDGITNSTTINSGGSQWVLGVAENTTINSYGSQFVSSGGTATNTTVESGGAQYVSSGGIAARTSVSNLGSQIVYSGGTAISTIINSGGYQYTSSGGMATSTAVNSGGNQFVWYGGTATSTTINFSGRQTVLSFANNTTINSGGNQFVNMSGMAINTIINSGGSQGVFDSGAATITAIFDGYQTIYTGGTATSTTINAWGFQIISSGGTANITAINSGGNQYVSSGGTANDITINSVANQTIFLGGTANSTIVNSGYQYAASGGIANSTTINGGGYQYVYAGGVANNATINDGYQYVLSGGAVNSTIINSNGNMVVYAGGSAIGFIALNGNNINWEFNTSISGSINGITVSASGKSCYNLYLNGTTQHVLSGYTADKTTINSSGRQHISNGGIANSTTINASGYQYIYSGGFAGNTILNSGGSMSVSSGGLASNTSINSGGSMSVSSGGLVSATTINLGWQYVISGGVANYTTIVSGGCFQNVIYGGVANYTTINSLGAQNLLLGEANYTTISSGGRQVVSSGSIANTTTISGGMQYIFSGGEANSTTIYDGGMQIVSFGGVNFTTINSGGRQFIALTGEANSTIINGGGQQIISSSGVANSTTVGAGGKQIVYGSANIIVQESGAAIVTNTSAIITGGVNTRADGHTAFSIVNGIASNFMLENGGQLTVSSGHSALDTVVGSGGKQIVYGSANIIVQESGAAIVTNTSAIITGGVNTRADGHSAFSIVNGIASNFLLENGGQLTVSSGHSALDTVAGSGGNQYVYGEARFTAINNSGGEYVYGITNSTVINSGGIQNIFSNGVASNTVISSAGTQIVSSGGNANNTAINIGGIQNVLSGGTANSTAINNFGSQYISSGGIAKNTTISGFAGSQYISSGGTASSTVIYSGGQGVSSGGNAIDTNIFRGYQNIYNGGIATSTTINDFGWQFVSSGGSATSTTINSSIQTVSSGGTAAGTTINCSGRQNVFSGGVTNFSIINSGGKQVVFSGGSAADIIVNSGGSMYASSGGIVSGGLTIDGGHALVDSSDNLQVSTMNFKLAAAQASDALLTINSGMVGDISHTVFSLDVNNTATGLYILSSGSDLTGMSSALFTVTNDGQSVSLQVGSSYTFADGDNLSLSFTDAAIDQLTATFTIETVPPSTPSGLSRTITGNSVALDWNDSIDTGSGVKQYEIMVDNNADFSSPEYSASPVASAATVNSLADGIYYWKVRTQDNAGNYSDWTTGSSFSVDITAPSAPATLTSTVTGSSVAIDWADASDATSGVKQYEYQLDNNSDFLSNEKSGTVVTSDVNVTGLADGSYYWRVRTVDNSGNFSDWTSGSNFTVDITAPSVPATLTRTVTGSSVALEWADANDAPSGVKQYEFQIDSNNDFSSNEKSGTTVASETNAITLADGTYFWRVRTQDNSGNFSAWTSGSSFTVDIAAPSVPASLTRAVTGNSAVLDWADAADATSGVKQYEVQLDKHADFSSTEYSLSPVASTATISNLTDGTFYWRVRTQDNSGNYSAWSSGSSFVSDVGGTISGALLLSSPSTTGRVGTGDAADYYKITMTNAGTLTLGLTGLTGNADLILLDSKLQLKVSSNPGTSNESIVQMLLAGDYYVKVAPGFGVKDAAYTLNHTEKYYPLDTAANTWLAAKDISGGVDNWVGFGDAADVYKITMTSAGTLTLGLTGLTGNADLSLLNSAGTLLKSSAKTGTADEAISNVLLLAGTYYVKVAPATGVNDANYSLAHTEKYTPVDKAANDYKTALDISTLDNWVGFGDTADFYKLTMTNAGMLTLGLTGLTGNADLTLLNAGGMQLKTSSNTGITSEAITNVALLAGIYYVKVATGYGVNDVGYTLTHTEKYTPADTGANTWQTAKQIDDGVDNWVGFGDTADFYKLTMTNAGMLSLGLTGLTGNADLTLLNASGMQLKSSSSTGTTPETINNVALLAGTYYVKVAAGFGVNDAAYTLTHAEKYTPVDKAANDYKTALDISTLDNWVGFGDTADFYKLTMTNAGTLTLGLTGLTGNADLALLNSAGTALKTSANAGTANEAINNVSLLAGTYYVKVATGYGVNDASYNLSNTVSYFPGDTSDKAGNTPAAAKLVDSPAQTGWVGFGDSDDYYKFDLAAAAQGTLRLYDMTGGNADLTLYDAKGAQLQKSAKTGALEDTITRNLAAGTYYARVNAVSGNIDYKLDFSKKDGYGMLAS